MRLIDHNTVGEDRPKRKRCMALSVDKMDADFKINVMFNFYFCRYAMRKDAVDLKRSLR